MHNRFIIIIHFVAFKLVQLLLRIKHLVTTGAKLLVYVGKSYQNVSCGIFGVRINICNSLECACARITGIRPNRNAANVAYLDRTQNSELRIIYLILDVYKVKKIHNFR